MNRTQHHRRLSNGINRSRAGFSNPIYENTPRESMGVIRQLLVRDNRRSCCYIG